MLHCYNYARFDTMNPAVILTTAATGFGVAFLHAAIPVHWLPFVLAGRAQGWGSARTLAVTMLAGAAHVAVTGLIGVLVAVLGLTVDRFVEGVFPQVAAAVLLLFALYFFRRQYAARHAHDRVVSTQAGRRGDGAVVAGLVTTLMFSPCEAFIPVYVAGVPFGWTGFLLLTLVLALATLGAMALFVSLVWRGLATPRLAFVSRYENALIGIVLLLLALFVLLAL
jgi:hypothetical protein